MRNKLLREILCGLLLGGLLIAPAQPAQAQWTTFDPSAYTQRIRSEIKRALEWSEKVRQYQMLYTNAVNQLTTLRGVLETVDKEMAKNKELARLTNDISEIIRGSVKLKNQVANQTRYQINALQQIDDRLRNGIFDPEQDLQDFENYLLHSMGRNSKQTIRLLTQTATADVLIQGWMKQKQDAERDLATANERLEDLRDRLNNTSGNANDPSTTQPLNEAIQQTEALIASLKKQIAELTEKITQRANLYGVRLSDMENFAYQVQSAKVAWLELQQTKQEISKAFDAAVVGMKDTP